jgi:predicted nucleic acid-binding protein
MPMPGKVFLDTNIWIYAYSVDDNKRQLAAQKLIETHQQKIVISTQVINEFVNVLQKKYKIDIDTISLGVEEVVAFSKIHRVDVATIRTAIAIVKAYNYSFFDSLIIASAYENKCSILYSEDMHNSHVIFGVVTIKNPFIIT